MVITNGAVWDGGRESEMLKCGTGFQRNLGQQEVRGAAGGF